MLAGVDEPEQGRRAAG